MVSGPSEGVGLRLSCPLKLCQSEFSFGGGMARERYSDDDILPPL